MAPFERAAKGSCYLNGHTAGILFTAVKADPLCTAQ